MFDSQADSARCRFEAGLRLHPSVRGVVWDLPVGESSAITAYIVDDGTVSSQTIEQSADVLRRAVASPLTIVIVRVPAPTLSGRRWNAGVLGAGARNATPIAAVTLVVTAIWLQVLGTSEIGPCDRFLDIGGDSLHALQIVTRVNQALHGRVLNHDLLVNPTVTEFSSRILEREPVPGRTATLARILLACDRLAERH